MCFYEELSQLLVYDPKSGCLTWKEDRPIQRAKYPSKAGDIATRMFRLKQNTYLIVCYRSKNHLAHRLAHMIKTGTMPPIIDHIDNDGTNNRWDNLRGATHAENIRNSPVRKHSSTGLKGARKEGKRFVARITVNKRCIKLGTFATAEEAHEAYVRAAIEHHGEFARFQ